MTGQEDHRRTLAVPGARSDLDWLVSPAPARRLRRVMPLLGILTCLLVAALVYHHWTRSPAEAIPKPSQQAPVPRVALPARDAPFAPQALRPMGPAEAKAWNAKIAVAETVTPPARAFLADLSDGVSLSRSLDCLAAAIYYEAGNEPVDGQRAVAQVVLNRVRHPAYPHSICAVIFEGAQRATGCQFTFACDGSLERERVPALWAQARTVAAAALAGYVYRPIGWATHYHADYVAPYWAGKLTKIGAVGPHIFYRWRGAWGQEGAFTAAYAGSEPLIPWQSAQALRLEPAQVEPETLVASGARPILAHIDMATPTEEKAATEVSGGAAARSRTSERWVLAGPRPVDAADKAPSGSPKSEAVRPH